MRLFLHTHELRHVSQPAFGILMPSSRTGGERLTQGQWARYLVVTFRGKGEPVLQPGNGERFGKRIESRADREGNGQMKNGEMTPNPGVHGVNKE
jgi:hypothetical protein